MGAPIFIAGATATGKSEVAMEIARRIKGEIISVDSMQVYQEMDMGTAKPSPEHRKEIPHHLIDCITLKETYNAARFVREAEGKIRETESPIFCGGTGLYFQAWTEGLGDAPPADFNIRKELEETPKEKLLEELEKKDPETYKTIDKNNPRRIFRAVEVIRITGKGYSQQRAKWEQRAPKNFFLLGRRAEKLRARIEARVERMFKEGLVEETIKLQTPLEKNRTAQQALGYKQVMAHLKGERNLPDTEELVKSLTWQYARRQKTWFNKILGAKKILIAEEECPKETADRILEAKERAS
tara:strand:- start:359 stop:1252 length:894 start_codon:yes stop_codon:yes gene_type:complete